MHLRISNSQISHATVHLCIDLDDPVGIGIIKYIQQFNLFSARVEVQPCLLQVVLVSDSVTRTFIFYTFFHCKFFVTLEQFWTPEHPDPINGTCLMLRNTRKRKLLFKKKREPIRKKIERINR